MQLIFEKSRTGRGSAILPPSDVPAAPLPDALRRQTPLRLPEVAECDLDRHYAALDLQALRTACAAGFIRWARAR